MLWSFLPLPDTHTECWCQGMLSHSCLSSQNNCGPIPAWRIELLCMSWSPQKMKKEIKKEVQVGIEFSKYLPPKLNTYWIRCIANVLYFSQKLTTVPYPLPYKFLSCLDVQNECVTCSQFFILLVCCRSWNVRRMWWLSVTRQCADAFLLTFRTSLQVGDKAFSLPWCLPNNLWLCLSFSIHSSLTRF